MKKVLLFIILTATLTAAGLWFGRIYLPMEQQKEIARLLNYLNVEEDVMHDSFTIKTKEFIVKTETGRNLFKTYTDTVEYRFKVTSTDEERIKLKNSAGKAAMKTLKKSAKRDAARIKEGIRYYKDLNWQLAKLKVSLPSSYDNKVFVKIDRVRTILKERKNRYVVPSGELAKNIDDALNEIVSNFSGIRASRSVVTPGNALINWYNKRFVKYPNYRDFYKDN